MPEDVQVRQRARLPGPLRRLLGRSPRERIRSAATLLSWQAAQQRLLAVDPRSLSPQPLQVP